MKGSNIPHLPPDSLRGNYLKQSDLAVMTDRPRHCDPADSPELPAVTGDDGNLETHLVHS